MEHILECEILTKQHDYISFILQKQSNKPLTKPLRRKGFQFFDEIGELVNGTRATGQRSFRAGKPTENAPASAPAPYESVIDPELLEISRTERGRVSDDEDKMIDLNLNVNTQKKSMYEREMESLISSVSALFIASI